MPFCQTFGGYIFPSISGECPRGTHTLRRDIQPTMPTTARVALGARRREPARFTETVDCRTLLDKLLGKECKNTQKTDFLTQGQAQLVLAGTPDNITPTHNQLRAAERESNQPGVFTFLTENKVAGAGTGALIFVAAVLVGWGGYKLLR